ncbi:MAG: DUF4404 family protein [Gammaproteobacteria bacterium]|nr:DUF4404 family protein [Gammaproteobacteria bacterium]
MSKEELQKSLSALHAQVEKLDAGDPDVKARVEALVGDIERQIESPDDTEHAGGVISRLQSAIEHFEVEHPQLTGVLNRIMMTLSDMGI